MQFADLVLLDLRLARKIIRPGKRGLLGKEREKGMGTFGKARAVTQAELTTPVVSHRLVRVAQRHRRSPPPGRCRRAFVFGHGVPEGELIHHALELQARGLMHLLPAPCRTPSPAPASRPMRELGCRLREIGSLNAASHAPRS